MKVKIDFEVGQKVIFNNNYIDELQRHINNYQEKYEVENMPNLKQKYLNKVDSLQLQLDKAICFQGTITKINNAGVPQITTVVVEDGTELLARHLMKV